MTEWDIKRRYAGNFIDILANLNEEQTNLYATAVTGAALTNRFMAELSESKSPKAASDTSYEQTTYMG